MVLLSKYSLFLSLAEILLVFIHLDVAEFSKSLLVTKIMNICSIKPYFPCPKLYFNMCEVQG